MRHEPPAGDVRPVVGRVAGLSMVRVVLLGLEILPPGSSSVTGPLFASAGTTTSTREDSTLAARTLRPPANCTLRTLSIRRPRTRIMLPPLTGRAFFAAVAALVGHPLAQVTRMIVGADRYVVPPLPAEAVTGMATASAASAEMHTHSFVVRVRTFTTWSPLRRACGV